MCSVPNCDKAAAYEVVFYDVYRSKEVFYKLHESCPYLCDPHMIENEDGAETGLADVQLRKYRGLVKYPHTRSGGQGFVIYRPLA
jgi:hypothetical protein